MRTLVPILLIIHYVLSATVPFPATLNQRSLDHLTVENTCRWTNCDEPCPTGFSMVSRQGGAKHEMLWDHNHCGDKGMQYFCCPDNADRPLCNWRGHNNSGKCKAGCKKGEVEVGTLRTGCKTGFQSACCTLVTAVEAYGEYPRSRDRSSHAACPRSHPRFLFAASAGFGGEMKCDSGAKSFCCTSEVRPFTNCKWHQKATHLRLDGVCEASCPVGQIKLGMQRGSCPAGEEAYCCEGPPRPSPTPSPSPSPPPSPPPPSFGPQLREFQLNLQL
ncbi:hypothetical protein FB567DRAFT_553547 [Paraphoma chrysanthemicola]|uniref:Uncharacterized protein n=1 Tax=Paraphoma chrysanthemicola TaxID=798071 RepID=A0A8K0VTC0_9PLEO|nr:hypothetical protein FB567DRAFT_553547 [Paraphoma chrysanthemicola]